MSTLRIEVCYLLSVAVPLIACIRTQISRASYEFGSEVKVAPTRPLAQFRRLPKERVLSLCLLAGFTVLSVASAGSGSDGNGNSAAEECCECAGAADLLPSTQEACVEDLLFKNLCALNSACPEVCEPIQPPSSDNCGNPEDCCNCVDQDGVSVFDDGDCLGTTVDACIIRLSVGDDIPGVNAFSSNDVDGCITNNCYDECRGFPPTP